MWDEWSGSSGVRPIQRVYTLASGTMSVFLGSSSAVGAEPFYYVEASKTSYLMGDLNQGSGNSNPRTWVEFNSKLYFQASDGTNTHLYVWDPASPQTAPTIAAPSTQNSMCVNCENIAIVHQNKIVYINGAY